MNPLYRFFFKPTIPDRYKWAWMSATMAFVMFAFALLSFYRHMWFLGIFDLVLVIWNSLTCWVNWGIYREAIKPPLDKK